MATETTRYNLKKPDYNDTADIQDINSNMDIIDEELDKQAKQINDCLQPATKDNLGMVKVGDNLTITKDGKLNGAAPYTHPNDTNTRHVTDAQINTWNNKAPVHDHPYIPTSASCNKNWNWDGQGGQPTWLWGGNDPSNMFVYNPANFNVNYANSAGNASKLEGNTLAQVKQLIKSAIQGGEISLIKSIQRGVVSPTSFPQNINISWVNPNKCMVLLDGATNGSEERTLSPPLLNSLSETVLSITSPQESYSQKLLVSWQVVEFY